MNPLGLECFFMIQASGVKIQILWGIRSFYGRNGMDHVLVLEEKAYYHTIKDKKDIMES